MNQQNDLTALGGILKDCEEYSLNTYREYLEKNNSAGIKRG